MGETLLSKDLTGTGVPVFSANTDSGPWGYTSLNRRRLKRGTIVVGARGSIGFPRLPAFETFTSTQTTISVEPDISVVDSTYLHAVLCAADIRALAAQQAVPMLTIGMLAPLSIPLPRLDEQRRIAEVLRAVDDAIGSSRMAAEAARQANQTIRHELLGVTRDGNLVDLPADWEIRPLEALATVERGKFSIRPRNDPRFFGGRMPFIQTGDITAAGDYLDSHTQTLNELGVTVSRVFPAGTIMTTIAANIGDLTITAYPVACPDSVVGIEAREGVNLFWLYSVLSCFKVALDRASTQNAQKNINLQTLRPLLIPVPPPDLMNKLAETLEATADVAREAQTSFRQIEVLKTVVMGDLLSGRVRVPT
jgi:type I restriction enzyme S subunit